MSAVLGYVVRQSGYRVAEFFRHWYIASAKRYFNFALDRLARADRVLAWRITARHLFKPLYGDYSVIGYVFGFVFRVLRLLAASVFYVAFFVVLTAGYVAWFLVPLMLLLLVLAPLFS